jgi:hypothetical protein
MQQVVFCPCFSGFAGSAGHLPILNGSESQGVFFFVLYEAETSVSLATTSLSFPKATIKHTGRRPAWIL